MPVTVGVLSYQGSVAEHIALLRKVKGVRAIEVKTPEALAEADGLIIPGGESTTIAKLLRYFHLFEPLKRRIEAGMPVWGTCAGLILLAKNIEGEEPHLSVMDISVRRNAYGRQIDSFIEKTVIPEFSPAAIPLVFIRAPWIDRAGEGVRVLKELNGHIVAARQEHMLVTSFHPELTDSTVVHGYFCNMVKEAKGVADSAAGVNTVKEARRE